MRIALVQQHAGPEKQENVARGLRAFEAAARAGAQVIGFAELAFEPFYPQNPAGPESLRDAEPVPGPITDAFAAKARELGVVCVLNLFERDGARTFDCSPVIDADGSLLGRTRMIHITEYACFHRTGRCHNRLQGRSRLDGDGNQHEWPEQCRGPRAWRGAAFSGGRDPFHTEREGLGPRGHGHNQLLFRNSGQSHFIRDQRRRERLGQERRLSQPVRRHMSAGK
jgi:hypothetical protein